jgi:hypothetical protein
LALPYELEASLNLEEALPNSELWLELKDKLNREFSILQQHKKSRALKETYS